MYATGQKVILRGKVMIEKSMSIDEIVKKHPETIPVFEKFGLGCVGCQAALFENIEQGADVHRVDVELLIRSLNSVIAHQRKLCFKRQKQEARSKDL